MGRTRELTDDERRERYNAYHRAYYAAHKAEIREKQRRWNEANRESVNRKAREKYAANREKILAQRRTGKEPRKRQTREEKNRKRREYYAANRDRILAQNKKSKIKKYMAAMAEERKMDDGEHDTTAC